MRKNCERFVAALLSASMLLGICMPGAMAVTAEEEDRTNYVEVLPVTYEAPEDDETPVKTPETIDVTIETDGSVTVGERPEATPDEPEVEWKGEAEREEEDGSIKAEVTGSETYTPSEMVTDGADRVKEEGGETKGEETVETEVTEKPKHETTTGDPVESDAIPGSKPAESQPEEGEGGQTGGSESTTETTDKPTAGADQSVDETTGKPVLDDKGNPQYNDGKDTWDLTEDDLRDLVEKPEAPTEEGWKTAEDGNSSESSSIVTDEDGTETETKKSWKREEYTGTVDGKLVAGYKETTVETVEENGKIAPDMSARPENAKDVTSADGMAGYCYTEVITDENGVRIETFYTVYPEQGTYKKTTKTTTTKLTYAKQEKEGSVEITDVTVKEGDGHGSLTGTQGPQADSSKSPGYLEVDGTTGLRDNVVGSGTATGIGNSNFVWDLKDGDTIVNVWGASIYDIKTSGDKYGNNKTGYPTLYVVRSPQKDENGNIKKDTQGNTIYDNYYVYCADRGQGLNGSGYNLENLKDAQYFASEKWAEIESIAVNGYWGVKNEDATGEDPTYGSLDAFRKMLVDTKQMTAGDAAKITDGMALAVTQAAIWKYGSASGNTTVDDPFQSQGYRNPNTNAPNWLLTEEIDGTTQALMMQAYNILLGKADSATTENKSTDLIDAEDITNVKVTINGKEKDEDVYDTDLSFTMAVQPDRMKADDLIVTVKVGNESYTYRLEGAAQGDERTDVKVKKTGNDITYVLKGIKMPDGTEVSINLSGTQSLGKSAYLLTAEGGYNTSQSFVGVFEGEREVNVNVNLQFNASQPTATITTDTTVETKVDQTKQTSWADSWLKKIFYPKPVEPEEPDEPETPEIPVEPETPTEPEITEKPDNTEEIVDAATPAPKIDSVPKTGDDASVWMVLCVLSAAGLAVLNLPKKKAEQEV